MIRSLIPALRRPGLPATVALLALLAVPALTTLNAQTQTPAPAPATAAAPGAIATVPGMPPVTDPANLYSETAAGKLGPAMAGVLDRVYVPNLRSNDVYVIDPATSKVIDKYKVGRSPQHIVPSWDLKTLWVTNNAERGDDGTLTPIDPKTGKPGPAVAVDDPYNMYFTPDGKSAIVVAEARKRLDFRDPQTMAMQYSISVPLCGGINHADFSIDGRHVLFTCEFQGMVAKIDLVERKVLGYLRMNKDFAEDERKAAAGLTKPAPRKGGKRGPDQAELEAMIRGEVCTTVKPMPQDIRVSPDGKRYYVADMMSDGVHVIDGEPFKQVGFVRTGVGAHGLYPSRDGKQLYVANRGSNKVHGTRNGKGSVTVLDFNTGAVVAQWPIPGGGSPDMGNVSADGKLLWLSGRFDDKVYRIDTATGAVSFIAVGAEPHGLAVWPQPGRYSLGHTGNFR
jgi:YVTN family beta-propeller protein